MKQHIDDARPLRAVEQPIEDAEFALVPAGAPA